ncbi:hypothetical protein ACI7RC_18265 [Brevibacillus sp. B_LB10_24]|uniref:hypothetical protein n=1 Tax=Brevibacillus sp. B_LB10_24 TaxID=3380645 RepID=UPI0038BDE5F5
MQAGRERIAEIQKDYHTITQDLGERDYTTAELKEIVAAEKRMKDKHIPYLLSQLEQIDAGYVKFVDAL